MKESAIQEWLIRHIVAGKLRDLIDGMDAIGNAVDVSQTETFAPSFPIDYIIRKRSISSAHRAIHTLHKSSLVTETKNISFTNRETLYPDAILYDSDSGNFTLIEVKADDKTEREAITELLAYEHELKNHFPFLSNSKLFFVLISTEFNTLIEHSVASCVAWEAKQFLCLHLDTSKPEWRLKVRIPSSWQAIGQVGLPPGSLSTLSMYLTPLDEDAERFERAIRTAAEMIAREADRAKAHGFLLVWKDTWRKDGVEWGITLGAIDPHMFLPEAIKKNLIKRNDRLTEYFEDNKGDRCKTEMTEHAYIAGMVLQSYGSFQLGPVVPWEQSLQELRDRGNPNLVEFWGNLGDAVREHVIQPAVRHNLAPEIDRYALTWQDPLVGIPFLRDVCGSGLFQLGEYSCGDTFRLGRLLGELLSVCRMIETRQVSDLKNLSASFRWRSIEFTHAFREIRLRLEAVDEITSPPTIVLGSPDRAKETIVSLEAFVPWFAGQFLGESNKLQVRFFHIGLLSHALFDPYLHEGLDESAKSSIIQSLSANSNHTLEMCVNLGEGLGRGSDQFNFLLQQLEKDYFVAGPPNMSTDELIRQIKNVSEEVHAHLFAGSLLSIIDSFVAPASHKIVNFTAPNPDWQWLRDQIKQLRAGGMRFPAIGLSADGTIGTMQLHECPIGDVTDADNEVLFLDNRAQLPLILKVRWDKLISGNVFEIKDARIDVTNTVNLVRSKEEDSGNEKS